jgi:heptosyltransferase III
MSVVVAGAALAIHPGALGDVLLAIPALRALRAGAERLTLAAQPRIASLLAALGEIDEARDFESLRLDALFGAGHGARVPAAERIVCWFGASDAAFSGRLAGHAPRVTVAPSTSPTRPVWEHLLATVDESAAPPRREIVRVCEALVADGRAALRAAGVQSARRVVIVHPGAGGAAKRWPASAFAEALAPLSGGDDLDVVIHEGPADGARVAELARMLPSACVLRDPPLPALGGVLAGCAAYLGNDSGVSHLAAVVGAPAVVLFAAANLAWRPWVGEPRVVTVSMEHAPAAHITAVRDAVAAVLG